jgi:nicotinamidase-related amidase
MKTHKEYISKMDKSLFLDKTILEEDDCLLVIDMQNDFVDRAYTEKGKRHPKGKLPTHDSKKIIPGIVKLMDKFKKADAHLVATRDYHPGGKTPHCSFPIFGEHCVQGTAGSDIVSEIEKKLVTGGKFSRKKNQIVYKAYNSKIDSFGAFPYTKKLGKGRICGCTSKKCPTQFTGSWGLSKYAKYPKLTDPKKIPLVKILKGVSKKDSYVFICGVLGDFCVLDSARNARAAGYKNVVVVIDLIRNLRIQEKGKVVYPTTPKAYCTEAKKHGFYVIMSGDIKL